MAAAREERDQISKQKIATNTEKNIFEVKCDHARAQMPLNVYIRGHIFRVSHSSTYIVYYIDPLHGKSLITFYTTNVCIIHHVIYLKKICRRLKE